MYGYQNKRSMYWHVQCLDIMPFIVRHSTSAAIVFMKIMKIDIYLAIHMPCLPRHARCRSFDKIPDDDAKRLKMFEDI